MRMKVKHASEIIATPTPEFYLRKIKSIIVIYFPFKFYDMCFRTVSNLKSTWVIIFIKYVGVIRLTGNNLFLRTLGFILFENEIAKSSR